MPFFAISFSNFRGCWRCLVAGILETGPCFAFVCFLLGLGAWSSAEVLLEAWLPAEVL